MPHTSHERMNEIAAGLMRAKAAGHCSHENRRLGEWEDIPLIPQHRQATRLHAQSTHDDWTTATITCSDCGKVATWETLEDDRKELIEDWT